MLQRNATKINSLPDWSKKFFDPIWIQNRARPLATLRDAGEFIRSLPKSEQNEECWRTATEALLLVAEHGGDPMLPRIAMMRALHRRDPKSEPKPRRKRAKAYTIVR